MDRADGACDGHLGGARRRWVALQFVAKSGTILGEEASHSLTVSPTSSPEIKGVTDVAEYMEENGDLWSNADMLQV